MKGIWIELKRPTRTWPAKEIGYQSYSDEQNFCLSFSSVYFHDAKTYPPVPAQPPKKMTSPLTTPYILQQAVTLGETIQGVITLPSGTDEAT